VGKGLDAADQSGPRRRAQLTITDVTPAAALGYDAAATKTRVAHYCSGETVVYIGTQRPVPIQAENLP
jgi:hypothetical protein